MSNMLDLMMRRKASKALDARQVRCAGILVLWF